MTNYKHTQLGTVIEILSTSTITYDYGEEEVFNIEIKESFNEDDIGKRMQLPAKNLDSGEWEEVQ